MKTTNGEQRAESKAKAEITNRILNHVFSPGETVSENQLAESLAMSRTPIRTAMRELIAEGLLERTEPKGYIVPKLTGEDMQQVFLARRKLEGLAAELAAARATLGELRMLEEIQEELGEIYRDWDRDRFTSNNGRFHSTIARAGGNTYVDRFLQQCFWRSQLYIYAFDTYFITPGETKKRFAGGVYGPTWHEHGVITQAILSGNPEAARKAMEEHITASCESLLRRGD